MKYITRTALGLLVVGYSVITPAFAQDTYPPVEVLLQTGTTILGQDFSYPDGTPNVTVAIITMQSGDQTGWHVHDVPLIGYMLEGEITVDYGPDGQRTYRRGDALVEAFQTRHQGTNTGAEPARILAVFVGAEGVANTALED